MTSVLSLFDNDTPLVFWLNSSHTSTLVRPIFM